MLPNPGILLPKEDPNLPHTYNLYVYYHGVSEPEIIEVASHRYVDKVYVPVYADREITQPDGTKKIIKVFSHNQVLGPNPAPFLEYETGDDEAGCIPFSAFKKVKFDKQFWKVKEIREKIVDEKNKKIQQEIKNETIEKI